MFIILQIFFTTHAVFKVGEYSQMFPSFSWGIFSHTTDLDQWRTSKNIWWIISNISNTKRLCLTTFSNTENGAEKRMHSILMNFLVFGNLVKHCPECLIYHPKTKKKQRNKVVKIYAGYLRSDIQTLTGS